MINIYLNCGKEVIHRNDAYFDRNFFLKHAVDDTIKNIIYKIDMCKYTKNGFMNTQDGSGLAITNLSTGCKTVINVYTFPNILFSVEEAGRNALEEALKLPWGSVVMSTLPILRGNNINNVYNIIGVWDNPRVFNNYDDMFRAVDNY